VLVEKMFGCHTYSINDAQWPSREQWWNYTENRKSKVGAT